MRNARLLIALLIVMAILFVWLKYLNSEKVETDTGNLQVEDSLPNETKILLYFLDNTGEKFATEYRNVNLNDIKENMINTILTELIKGPNSSEFKSIIPKETKIKNIEQNESKVIVDFSSDFLKDTDTEEVKTKKIFSVVNTITEIKEIEEVEIRVDGREIAVEKRI